MNFNKRGVSAFLMVAAVASLSGCKKLADMIPGASNSSTGLLGGTGTSSDNGKLNAYVEGYNKLLDTFGFPEEYKNYREAKISSQSASDTISVSKGWIDQGRDKLKAARALSGSAPADLDAAADTLLGALDKVVTRLSGLETYYSSKAYREDGLARGKREDPLMLADFAAAEKAMTAFDAILNRELTRRDEVELATLKSGGDDLLYQTKLGLNQAKGVIGLFKSADDIANPALFGQADIKIAALEKTMAAQRTALAKAKSGGKEPSVQYGIIDTFLTTMIGSYRDLKQSHSADDYNSLIDQYNRAVEMGNDLRR